MDDCQESPYYRHEEVQYVSVEWSTYQRLTKQVEDVLTKNRKLKNDRETLLSALKIMIKSSVPHPTEHPTMTAAWKVAREAIAAAEREN